MAHIDDRSRTIFREAAGTVLDNFTETDLTEFRDMARRIDAVIKAAQKRQQETVKIA
jgi:hypothetical protein